MNKLIYIGDTLYFTNELSYTSSINSISKNITSTLDDFSDDVILYSRIEILFRVISNNFYSEWFNLKEFDIDDKSYALVKTIENESTKIEFQVKLIDVHEDWDDENDYIEIESFDISYTAYLDSSKEKVSSVGQPHTLADSTGLVNYLKHTYNPYDLQPIEQMHQRLNYMANMIYGLEANYVKVRSDIDKGRDFVLREDNLFKSTGADVKCLKINIPNNEYNPNNLAFNIYNIEFGDQFSIDISYMHFADMYGKNVIPQQFDIINIPVLERLYEVSSVMLQKGVNLVPMYWKLYLNKYEKRQNIIYEDQTVIDKINDVAKGAEDLFEQIVREEAKNSRNDAQLNNNKKDSKVIRELLNRNITFLDEILQNTSTVFSRKQYNLSSIYKQNEENAIGIVYNNKFEIDENSGSVFSVLLNIKDSKNQSINCTVTSSGSNYLCEITGKFSTLYSADKYISFWKKTSTGKQYKHSMKIVSINSERNILTLEKTVDETIVLADLNLVSTSNENILMTTGSNTYNRNTRVYSFVEDTLSNRNKISILDETIIKLDFFGTTYYKKLNQRLSKNQWYSINLSYNLKFNVIGISVYDMVYLLEGTYDAVENITIEDIENIDYRSSGKITMLASNHAITNIRILKKSIESKILDYFIISEVINNSSDYLVIDNADNAKVYENYELYGK